MPYPKCGRSIKTYARGNNDAPSITKYASPVRLDAQLVALRLHCARTALKVPPRNLCEVILEDLGLNQHTVPTIRKECWTPPPTPYPIHPPNMGHPSAGG